MVARKESFIGHMHPQGTTPLINWSAITILTSKHQKVDSQHTCVCVCVLSYSHTCKTKRTNTHEKVVY